MKTLLFVMVLFLSGTSPLFSEKIVIVMDWNRSSIELKGTGMNEETMYLVKKSSIAENLPDTIIAPGERTADGWKFHFEVKGPEVLNIRSNNQWYLDDVFVRQGDSLVFAYEGGKLNCKGDGSYINSVYLNLLSLCPFESGNEYTETTYEELEGHLDSCMAVGMKKYKSEVEAESIPLLFRTHIRAMLYAKWATPRLVYLCKMYYVQQVREVPPSGRFLRFLSRIPGDVFAPPYMKQFETFSKQLFQIYLGEEFYNSGAGTVDDIIIQNALQNVRSNHIGNLRDNVTFNTIYWLIDSEQDAVEPMLNYLMDDFGTYYSNRDIYEAAGTILARAHSIGVGDKAPEFAARDIKGNSVRLADMKGKPVLLYFWGTWCESCAKNLSEVKALIERTRELGVQVVLVANEFGDLSRWQESASLLDTPVMSIGQLAANDENIARQYDISSYPSSVLINKYGYVIANDASLVTDDAGSQRLSRLLE